MSVQLVAEARRWAFFEAPDVKRRAGLMSARAISPRQVDSLSQSYDVCARVAGGSNAGHTIVVGDRTYKFHLLPSGVLSPRTVGVIGNGVVVHIPTLLKEIKVMGPPAACRRPKLGALAGAKGLLGRSGRMVMAGVGAGAGEGGGRRYDPCSIRRWSLALEVYVDAHSRAFCWGFH